MSVRLATLSDIPAMLRFGKAKYDESNYAGIPFNHVIARRTFKTSMTVQGSRTWISVKDGDVRGILIGQADPHPWAAAMCASDLVFVADAEGDVLLDSFLRWCKALKVSRLDMGVSQGDPDGRLDKLYERRGFIRTGSMFFLQEAPEVKSYTEIQEVA